MLPRLSTRAMMLIVLIAALATWNCMLFAGLDAKSRRSIFALVAVLAAYAAVIVAGASVGKLFGRKRPPETARSSQADPKDSSR